MYKAGPCFNFAFDSSIKLKRAAILFYKKVVPLNFGFDSLGNEQNFLSNQKAGKLMNVTRNKLFQNEDLKRKDRDEWTENFEMMRDLLKKGADLAFDAGKIGGQTKEKYAMSGMFKCSV